MYGIKIKNQETGLFEMYPSLFVDRRNCEEVISNLAKLSFISGEDIQLVEIWDRPDKVPESDPEPKDLVQELVDRRIEDEAKAEEAGLEWLYKHCPWLVPYLFPGLERDKMYVSVPDITTPTPWFGILDPVTGQPLGPRYKSECGDGSEYPCSMESFAKC